MVKSINAYFDSLVDRGGPFLRLAMGHSVRGVALLVVGMVAGIMLQYLPDVVLNCLVFLLLPFASILLNRTFLLWLESPSSCKMTPMKNLVRCEPVFFANHLKDTSLTDAWVTSCLCQFAILVGCLPLSLTAMLTEGRVGVVIEIVLFSLLISLIASFWTAGAQFTQKRLSIGNFIILFFAFTGLLTHGDSFPISFFLSLYSLQYTLLSMGISALMVAIVVGTRAYVTILPDVSTEFVPRCTLLIGCIVATLIGKELLHPVAIVGLCAIAVDVLTAHQSNPLKCVPSLFTRGKYNWIFRLFFFPGWPSLSLFCILTVMVILLLEPLSLGKSIFASDSVRISIACVFTVVVLVSQICEIRKKPIYLVPVGSFVLLAISVAWSHVLVVNVLIAVAFVFLASIVYGAYQYLKEGSDAGTVRAIVETKTLASDLVNSHRTRAGEFLSSYLETGRLFLWYLADSSMERGVKYVALWIGCINILILLCCPEISTEHYAITLISLVIVAFYSFRMMIGFLLEDTHIRLISKYRQWHSQDKKLAMLALPMVAAFALLPGLLFFPENLCLLGKRALIIFLFLIFGIAAGNSENDEGIGYRQILIGYGLFLFLPIVLVDFPVRAIRNENHPLNFMAFKDSLTVIYLLLFLTIWFFPRKSGPTRDFLYLRSSALLIVILTDWLFKSPSLVVCLLAIVPLVDTILFELMQTPKMLPSLHRGSRLSTVASVIINPGWPGAFIFAQVALVVLYFCSSGFPEVAQGNLLYYMILAFGCMICPIAAAIVTGKCVTSANYIYTMYGIGFLLMIIARKSAYFELTVLSITLLSWPIVMYGLYRHIQLLLIKRDYYCASPETEFPWGR